MSARSAPSSRPRSPTTRCQNTWKSSKICRARIPARSSSAVCAIPIGKGRGGGFRRLACPGCCAAPLRGALLIRGLSLDARRWVPVLRSSVKNAAPRRDTPAAKRFAPFPSIFILHCGKKLAHSETAGQPLEEPTMSPQTMPSETEVRTSRAEEASALEEDTRLRNDIRLLGRILGDTVRDQEGADVFDLVERIRQTSIRFHRDDDEPARRELELNLDSMSTSQTVRIVRAFSYFSHLANIAEDQNNIRQMRTRSNAGGTPPPGTLALTLLHARGAGFSAADLRKFFATAQVSPVLTAHPPEVRRKSTIDREMEIAALLDRRERVQLTPEELDASNEQLRRAVLTLWQTNILRRTKLTVLDEVANGLSFYDYTFLHEVPRMHCVLEDRLNEGEGAAQGELASFLRMGSWIGGDRDGNPFVTAEVMRGTLKMQSSRVLRFYLEELHALGAELSLAAHLADVSKDLRAPAGRSPAPSPHRSGEPYRLAVSGIYARLTATAVRLDVETTRPPVGEAAPYASASEFKTDLDILHRSLIANNSGAIHRGGRRLLGGAVDCFGFHLANLDMRQNVAVHERSVPELLDPAPPGMSYLALNEEARIALLASELRNARPLTSSFVKYSEETLGELAVFHAAAEAHSKFGAS